jgi:hypothetical protein
MSTFKAEQSCFLTLSLWSLIPIPMRKTLSDASKQMHRCVVMTLRSLVADCSLFFLIILTKRNANSVSIIEMHEIVESTIVIMLKIV